MTTVDAALLWVRVLGVWHVENEAAVTLCGRQTPPRAERRAKEPILDQCLECAAIRRRLRELEEME